MPVVRLSSGGPEPFAKNVTQAANYLLKRPKNREFCPQTLISVYFGCFPAIRRLSRPVRPLRSNSMPVCRLLALVLLLLSALVPTIRLWGEEPTKTETPANQSSDQAGKASREKKADENKTKFIRVRRSEDNKPLALETAIVRYVPKEGDKPLVVDLVGAVHVGDKSYYEELNKRFKDYDVVLYELVAPPGAKIPKGGRGGNSSGHPVGAMQDGLKSILDLDHQLDQIDYTADNFVHADMSPDEFSKTMADRGESFMQMFFRLMGQGAAQQATGGGSNDIGMLFALFSRDRAQRMKLMMAEQFENLEGQMAAFDGPEGSTIITERNKKAFEVLDRELKNGKTKIAVFYGAGHLPDMEERLIRDFQMKRADQETQWIPAWSLESKKTK